MLVFFFFFKQKTAYEMRISDWSSDVCSSDLFGQVPRIVLASIVAFWTGEFANSFVLAKMKVWTAGRLLWTRTVGATIVGQGIDSLIFSPLAFSGVWDAQTLLIVLVTQFALQVGWVAVLQTVTSGGVGGQTGRVGVA